MRLTGCRLTGTDMTHALLRDAVLSECRMDYLNLARAKAERVAFQGGSLREAALEECTLRHAEFFDCDMTRVTIHLTPMKGVDLRTCRLDGITCDLPSLRGMTVNPLQAAALARLLGLDVKD